MKRWQILLWVFALGLLVGAMGAGCSRKRQEVKRSFESLMHVRDIRRACLKYAEGHEWRIPKSLEEVTPYLGGGRVPESPRKPADYDGPSYIYVKALGGRDMGELESTFDKYVIVYENPFFCGDDISVGFLAGRVEKMTSAAFRQALEDTYKKLGVPMPEGGS